MTKLNGKKFRLMTCLLQHDVNRALFRVLQKKGIVTQREVLDELALVKKEISGRAS